MAHDPLVVQRHPAACGAEPLGVRRRGRQLVDDPVVEVDEGQVGLAHREVDPEDAFTYAVDKRPFARYVPEGTAILRRAQ